MTINSKDSNLGQASGYFNQIKGGNVVNIDRKRGKIAIADRLQVPLKTVPIL